MSVTQINVVKGDPGDSAYLLAVKAGEFAGTEAEYRASLVGEDGEDGQDGSPDTPDEVAAKLGSATNNLALKSAREALDIGRTNFDIIVLLGQSEMVFSEAAPDLVLDQLDARIYQFGINNREIEIAQDPLDYISNNQTTIAPGLSIAKEYIRLGLLDGGRNVLLVPAAQGSTGFANNFWLPAGTGPTSAINAVRDAIAETGFGSVDRVVAFCWLQGQSDVAAQMSESVYAGHLDTLIDQMRSSVSTATESTPFIVAPLLDSYVFGGLTAAESDEIRNAQRDTVNRKLYTALAESNGLTSYDNTHRDGVSSRETGFRIARAIERAKKNVFMPVEPDRLWVFGHDNAAGADVQQGSTMEALDALPVPKSNYLEFQTTPTSGFNGLISDVPYQFGQTLFGVFRAPNNNTLLMGTLVPSSNEAGGGSVFINSGGNLSSQHRVGSGPNYSALNAANWYFIAYTYSDTEVSLFLGDQTASQYNSVAQTINFSERNIALGNGHYGATLVNGFDCAEFGIVNEVLDQTQIESIYQSSIQRMAKRGITLV